MTGDIHRNYWINLFLLSYHILNTEIEFWILFYILIYFLYFVIKISLLIISVCFSWYVWCQLYRFAHSTCSINLYWLVLNWQYILIPSRFQSEYFFLIKKKSSFTSTCWLMESHLGAFSSIISRASQFLSTFISCHILLRSMRNWNNRVWEKGNL